MVSASRSGVRDAGDKIAARVMWVDVAKGVGILLVIAGHVWWEPGPVHRIIYAFHMPLFFLLSGYMVKPQPTLALVPKQIRTLLVPFLAFSLLLIAADMIIETSRHLRPMFPSFGPGLWAILFKTEATRGPFTILWFVPCLFFARIVWNAIAAWIPDSRDWRWPMLIAAIMSVATWIAANSVASPMGIMAVPAALALFWVGQLWKVQPPGLLLLVLLILLAAAAFLWFAPINLKAGDYGTPLLSLAGAAAISILLCRGLATLPVRLCAPLAWLGQVSLVVMYVHVAFIHYCAPYFGKGILFVLALAGSLLIHFLAAATRPGRVLFLGKRG